MNDLKQNEIICQRGVLSKTMFFLHALAIFLGVAFLLVFQDIPKTLIYLVLLSCCFCLIVLVLRIVYYFTTDIAITSERLIVKSGLVFRKNMDISLQNIKGCRTHDNIIGRFFGYATLIVIGIGGTPKKIEFLEFPVAFQNALYDAQGLKEKNQHLTTQIGFAV